MSATRRLWQSRFERFGEKLDNLQTGKLANFLNAAAFPLTFLFLIVTIITSAAFVVGQETRQVSDADLAEAIKAPCVRNILVSHSGVIRNRDVEWAEQMCKQETARAKQQEVFK